jgi:recombination protein RecA
MSASGRVEVRVGSLVTLSALREQLKAPARAEAGAEAAWALPELAGRLVELCSHGPSATWTLAMALVLDAQRRAEPAAWLTGTGQSFFPPDAAASGVDLDALAVVRAPDPAALARAADPLLRSGAFGLVVLDLGKAQVAAPLQSRLLGLAQKHQCAVVFLTEKPPTAPSLGPLVSLRAEVVRAHGPEGFRCELRVVKDKRRAPGWAHVEVCRGPPGLP